MGVYLGDNLYGPRFDNPKGFFEDKSANQLNEAVLKLCHCWWGSLFLPAEIPPNVVDYYQHALKENIFKRFAERSLWGLKDPRVSRLWRLWLPVFEETGVTPAFVLANRHPFSVASSLAKRDRMPRAHALALWIIHQLDALEAVVEHGGLLVDYDLMIKGPREQLYRIGYFLGTSDRLGQEEIERFERDFLDQDLRHAHFQNESGETPLQKLCLDLYKELLALARLPGGLNDIHIDHACNLVAEYRSELAKSTDWLEAIDALNNTGASNSVDDSTSEVHSLITGISKELANVADLLKSNLHRRDQALVLQSMRLEKMREELLRAEAQLDLLKDVMLGSREEDRL